MLLPNEASKLMARWQGPSEIIRRVRPIYYEIWQPIWRKTQQSYHINMLEKWNGRESLFITPGHEQQEFQASGSRAR